MMNTIKGLMLKDLYVFKNYKSNIYFSLIMVIILIAIASFEIDVFAAGSIIFLIFFGMNSISTFSYDENAESDDYLLSLTITRKDIVISKYLFTFLTSAISIISGIIISYIITIIIRGNVDGLGNALRICFIAFTSSSFLMCTDIPCIYKWGVEKGRMQSTIIPALLIFVFGLIGSLILLLFSNLYNFVDLKLLFKYSPIICLILNIIFYFLSYYISFKIFSKKSL